MRNVRALSGRLEVHQVHRARDEAWPWERIGTALDQTRQDVPQRYKSRKLRRGAEDSVIKFFSDGLREAVSANIGYTRENVHQRIGVFLLFHGLAVCDDPDSADLTTRGVTPAFLSPDLLAPDLTFDHAAFTAVGVGQRSIAILDRAFGTGVPYRSDRFIGARPGLTEVYLRARNLADLLGDRTARPPHEILAGLSGARREEVSCGVGLTACRSRPFRRTLLTNLAEIA
ncbi:hypothetical protein [Amycolatopsis magusensis]|uniref:hypothetical protein n=1 Tax=Amycolatopsis magusensis TaxID=882444 RepID=UPI00379C98FA